MIHLPIHSHFRLYIIFLLLFTADIIMSASAQRKTRTPVLTVEDASPTPSRSESISMPSASFSHTSIQTETATATASFVATDTASDSPARTQTASETGKSTATASGSTEATGSVSGTQTFQATWSATATKEVTASTSPTVKLSASATSSATQVRSATLTMPTTRTLSKDPTLSITRTEVASQSASMSETATEGSSRTSTLTEAASRTRSDTPTISVWASFSDTASEAASVTRTGSLSGTASPSHAATSTASVSSVVSSTRTLSATLHLSATLTRSEAPSRSGSVTVTNVATSTMTASQPFTQSGSETALHTMTATPSDSSTPSIIESSSISLTTTVTDMASGSTTKTPDLTATATSTWSITRSASHTATLDRTSSTSHSEMRTLTVSHTVLRSASPTASGTVGVTATRTRTLTLTVALSYSHTATPSPTTAVTSTVTFSNSMEVRSLTQSLTATATLRPSLSTSHTDTARTPSASAELTATPTLPPTRSQTFSASATGSPSATESYPTPSPTMHLLSPSESMTDSTTINPTDEEPTIPTPTPSWSPSGSVSPTGSQYTRTLELDSPSETRATKSNTPEKASFTESTSLTVSQTLTLDPSRSHSPSVTRSACSDFIVTMNTTEIDYADLTAEGRTTLLRFDLDCDEWADVRYLALLIPEHFTSRLPSARRWFVTSDVAAYSVTNDNHTLTVTLTGTPMYVIKKDDRWVFTLSKDMVRRGAVPRTLRPLAIDVKYTTFGRAVSLAMNDFSNAAASTLGLLAPPVDLVSLQIPTMLSEMSCDGGDGGATAHSVLSIGFMPRVANRHVAVLCTNVLLVTGFFCLHQTFIFVGTKKQWLNGPRPIVHMQARFPYLTLLGVVVLHASSVTHGFKLVAGGNADALSMCIGVAVALLSVLVLGAIVVWHRVSNDGEYRLYDKAPFLLKHPWVWALRLHPEGAWGPNVVFFRFHILLGNQRPQWRTYAPAPLVFCTLLAAATAYEPVDPRGCVVQYSVVGAMLCVYGAATLVVRPMRWVVYNALVPLSYVVAGGEALHRAWTFRHGVPSDSVTTTATFVLFTSVINLLRVLICAAATFVELWFTRPSVWPQPSALLPDAEKYCDMNNTAVEMRAMRAAPTDEDAAGTYPAMPRRAFVISNDLETTWVQHHHADDDDPLSDSTYFARGSASAQQEQSMPFAIAMNSRVPLERPATGELSSSSLGSSIYLQEVVPPRSATQSRPPQPPAHLRGGTEQNLL
eukprot:PhM_4_TR17364/c0_g1_i1/m.35397